MTDEEDTHRLESVKAPHYQRFSLVRSRTFYVLLGAVLCLIGSLLFLMGGTTLAFPGLDVAHQGLGTAMPIPRVDPTPTPTVQTIQTAASAALTPLPAKNALPAPISPFPWDVRQQVGVLQAHGRFFFGGNPGLPEIALTFDDGPYPPYTNEVLAVLKQYNVKASFFCVGRHVTEHPELVKQEFDAGHTVAIHSWNHVNLPSYSAAAIDAQLSDTSDILKKVTGVQPNFFRPPYGAYNSVVLAQANKLGLTTFLWNDVASDWLLPGSSVISARVINAARYGSIILLHDGDGDHYNQIASREQTVQALPTIITVLRARGYRFVTLDQLVADMHK